MKKKVSARLDAELLDEAKKMDLHLPQVFTEALQRVTRKKVCPLCKQVVKKK